MAPKLYLVTPSPPARAVQLCARAIDLELELQNVSLVEKEHLKPEFLKINPQHTVPTLDDNGFIIWDSHAIMSYLVNKYGKDDSLYPNETQARALVDQRLYFDTGLLFPRMLIISKSIYFHGAKTIPQEWSDSLIEAYGYLEKYLEKTKFVSADHVTIADFAIVATVTTGNITVPIEEAKFPKTFAWIKEMEKLPYYEANKVGLDIITNLLKTKLGIIKN